MLPTMNCDPLKTRVCLERVAPGFYLDAMGSEYFYLTGMLAFVTKRLWDNPHLHLNTAAFVAETLENLRRELNERLCTELMD